MKVQVMIASLLLFGCSSLPFEPGEQVSTVGRGPASNLCEPLFKSTTSDTKVREAFADIEKIWGPQNKALVEYYLNPVSGRGGVIVQGLHLADQLRQKNAYAIRLKNEFKFELRAVKSSEINDRNRNLLKTGDMIFAPSLSLVDYFLLINRRIRENIEQGLLSPDDALWPALIFTREDRVDGLKFLAIRPGMDKLPKLSDGWVIDNEKTELSQAQFAKAVSDGALPLPGFQFYHDIGHFADLLKNSRAMAAWKNYNHLKYEKVKQNAALKLSHEDFRLDQINAIEYYINEFLFLPEKSEFKSLFGFSLNGKDLTRTRVEHEFSSVTENEAIELAQKIIAGFSSERLITRYGGATHDAAFERYMNDTRLLYYMKHRLATNSLPPDAVSADRKSVVQSDFSFLHEDFPGLVELMKLTLHFYGIKGVSDFDLMMSRTELIESAAMINDDAKWKGMSVEEEKAKLIGTLRNLIGEFYFRGAAAIDLDLTPESIVGDLQVYLKTTERAADRGKTKIHQYYSKISPTKNSVFHGLFIE